MKYQARIIVTTIITTVKRIVLQPPDILLFNEEKYVADNHRYLHLFLPWTSNFRDQVAPLGPL